MLDSFIDTKQQSLFLSGEVNIQMYKVVAQALTRLSDEFTIVLNTEGGDVYQALAIYDLLKFSEAKIKIVCVGPVMSAGVIILQAASERVAMPNAQIMVHYGEDSNDSSSTARHNADLLKLMKKIIGDRALVKRRTINQWFVKDTYFNSLQALKAGLVDRVVEIS